MKKTISWQNLVKRRAPLLMMYSLFEGFTEDIEKYIGVSLDTNLVAGEKVHQVSTDKVKLAKIGGKVLKKTVENPQFVKDHSKECYEACDELVRIAKQVSTGNLKKLTKKEILKRFTDYEQTFKHFAIFLYVPHSVEMVVGEKVMKLFEKSSFKDISLVDLLVPTKFLESSIEQHKLVNLAKNIKTEKVKNYSQELKRHYEKYRWITMFAMNDKPAKLDYFEVRLQNLLTSDLDKKLEDFEKSKTSMETADKFIKKNLSGELLYLISILREYIFLRSYRGEMWAKAHFYLQPFLREVARRNNLTLTQLSYLSSRELVVCLKGKGLPPRKEIDKRVEAYALCEIEGKYILFSGPEKVKEIIKRELGDTDISGITEFKGTVASLGRAKGRARVILDVKDVGSLKRREILITVMTKPEYVIAMEKSAAIVTDEGGILSHAAIVSREMGIPCVIGTKIATRVLKTGDLIEVDAEGGIISKL